MWFHFKNATLYISFQNKFSRLNDQAQKIVVCFLSFANFLLGKQSLGQESQGHVIPSMEQFLS